MEEKKPVTVLFSNILIQFAIIIFYTVVWLNAPLFGESEINVAYFLFMFISCVIAGLLTLYSKAKPEAPIPKKPTQQFANLIKMMTDIIANRISKKTPAIEELSEIIQRSLLWSLREAKISPEFDKDTLEKAEDYIFEKLFPNQPKKSEKSSQEDGLKIN